MKRAPNFKKRNFSASKGQLGAPVQICFLKIFQNGALVPDTLSV